MAHSWSGRTVEPGLSTEPDRIRRILTEPPPEVACGDESVGCRGARGEKASGAVSPDRRCLDAARPGLSDRRDGPRPLDPVVAGRRRRAGAPLTVYDAGTPPVGAGRAGPDIHQTGAAFFDPI